MKIRNRLSGLLLAVLLSCMPLAFAAQDIRITLLQLNDVYQTGPVDKGQNAGLARVATLVRQIRQENPNTFFVLAGDTLSPSVEGEMFQGAQMIAAWNAMGLDFAVLGNHEFDYGDEVLKKRLAESRFQWLAANVKEGDQPYAGLPGYAIREMKGIKIGFLGLVTPDTAQDSSPGPEVRFGDPVHEACRAYVELKNMGADVVVGVTHLSMGTDKEIARKVPLAAILGGHEHSRLQSFAGRTPIFKVGSDARHLGRIDLYVDPHTKRLTSVDYELLPVTAAVAEDPEVTAAIRPYQEQVRQELGKVIGATTVELNAVQADVRSKETNLGNLIADAYREAVGADVAIVNGGSIRTNTTYGPGDITRRDVMGIVPFGSPVVKVSVSGKTLLAALEHGLGSDEREAGRFPQVSGLQILYDPQRAPGSRIMEARVGQEPVSPDKTYALAINTYLLGGGDGYVVLKDASPSAVSTREPLVEHEAVVEYFLRHKSVSPQVEGRIRKAGGQII